MQQPQQPVYVMRGHASPVHAVHFYRSNFRLISADAEGWVIIWNASTRRPVAVWKAHDAAVLGVADWNDDHIITHGRDNKIYIWKIRLEDEEKLDVQLPAAASAPDRKRPWLFHVLDVNALNFCSFAMCGGNKQEDASGDNDIETLLIAVPSSRDPNTIDIYQYPSGNRLHVGIGARLGFKTGIAPLYNYFSTMRAAYTICPPPTGMPMALKLLHIDSQLTVLAGYESGHAVVFSLNSASNIWTTTYSARPHSQPVLSLDFTAGSSSFYTSSADALIVKHPIPSSLEDSSSTPSQIVNTHHAGQQGLVVRSDGKVFATAGWDSRIRVYSGKTMKELAVLKWHKEGCYTVGLAKIFDESFEQSSGGASSSKELAQPDTANMVRTIGQQRDDRTRNAHWLAAGSKDGRVSIWEVF
ncbi:hypothetical protein ABW19_dt0204828 [Dactylella cylindrospora]|nr:hypothetical protein ABW19_dt0204828 [Dactylella cylindrospora]